MILKGFKEKSNKNYINSRLRSRIVSQSSTKIKHVGVIVNLEETEDVSNFKSLTKIFKTNESKIEIIGFKNLVKDKENAFNPTYSLKHIGWRGAIKNSVLKQFLNTEFDALISYYKKDETALKLLTSASNAKFKVGILEEDERINDLIIKTEINDFKTFTSEIEKYLQILNKI